MYLLIYKHEYAFYIKFTIILIHVHLFIYLDPEKEIRFGMANFSFVDTNLDRFVLRGCELLYTGGFGGGRIQFAVRIVAESHLPS